jgi:transcriptional regulator with XRE-family HTH domain
MSCCFENFACRPNDVVPCCGMRLAYCAFRSGPVKRKGLLFLRDMAYCPDSVVRIRTTQEVEPVSRTGESPASTRARKALYEARLKAGKTQEKASAILSTSTISRWESGVYEPSWDALDAYAHELKQSIVLWFGPPQTKEAPPPHWAAGIEMKLDLTLWALGVSPEEQAARLSERVAGEAWPPREDASAAPAAGERSANAR